jgi:hypothetical protein
MTEDILEKLPINAVFDLMEKRKNDLLEAKRKKDERAARVKKEEVELIKKFLVAKRVEFFRVK